MIKETTIVCLVCWQWLIIKEITREYAGVRDCCQSGDGVFTNFWVSPCN